MNDPFEVELFDREKKIETFTTGTPEENQQSLQHTQNKTLESGDWSQTAGQIAASHEQGMHRYTESHMKNILGERNVPDEYTAYILRNALAENASAQGRSLAQEGRNRAITRQEQYYFRHSERSTAKAERYKNLSRNDKALRQHSSMYDNRSASKRARKARNASKAYTKVAELQASYEQSLAQRNLPEGQSQDWNKAQSLADYNHLEQITRARIEALSLAAQAKSTSKQQENYSIQRGTLKNLLILKDSLEQLISSKETMQQKGPADIQEENQLREKLVKLNKEIQEVSHKVDQYVRQPNPSDS